MRSGRLGWVTVLLVGSTLFGVMAVATASVDASGSLPGQPANCSSGLVLSTSQSIGMAPLSVSFQLTVYWGIPVAVAWNFGDGAYLNGSGPGFFQPAHTYAAAGTYEAIVTVAAGTRTGACSLGIAATPPALKVTPSVDVASGLAPLTVHLSAVVTGGTGTYEDASWSFGDGTVANGFNLTHTYALPGPYRAEFTVIDTAGDLANGSVTIDVLATLPTPSHSTIGPGTLSLFGAAVLGIVAGAGALLYVGTRPLNFSDRRRSRPGRPPEDRAPTVFGPEFVPGPTGTEGPVTSTELATVSTLYPAATYRGVFLDLSYMEYAVSMAPEPLRRLSDERDTDPPGPPLGPGTSTPYRGLKAPGGVSLSQRVVLHLAAHPRLGPEDTATQPFTQAGMAEALGTQQSTLSNVLRRLQYSGVLHQETDHVRGVSRRVHIYSLTPKGERLAEKLKETVTALVPAEKRPPLVVVDDPENRPETAPPGD